MVLNKNWWWSFLLCCGWQVPAAHAVSSNEFLDMSLEELVDYRLMSMSRKEQRVADMAAAAHVISAEDIRRSGALSVPEALRLVPGLNVAQISRDRWAVSSRGFNERFSGKLLVLVDGRNVYSPTFSGVLWETQDLVMEDIERIEVIRGPGAALWGTNAMNGVINIVTRTAAASQGSMVSAAIGSGDQSILSMRQGGELANGGYYKLYAKHSTAAGSVERDSGKPGDDSTRQQRVGIRLEPQVEQGQLSIKAEAYEGRSSDVWTVPTVLAYSDPATPFGRASLLGVQDHGGSFQARYAWKGEQGTENILQAFVDHESSTHTGVWGTGTGLTLPLAQAPRLMSFGGAKTDLDVDFQQRRIFGNHDFIWGLNLRHTTDKLLLPAGPYLLTDGMSRRLNYSAFVHDEITLSPDQFKLILGSKFEKDGLTGFNIQPNARVLYTPNANEAFWSALSRSVRSPRRTESLATIDLGSADAGALNPSLLGQTAMTQVAPLAGATPRAEQAWSLEGGWRRQFSNFLSLDTSLFLTRYSHLRGARLLNTSPADMMQAAAQVGACATNPAHYVLSGATPLSQCYLIVPGYNASEDRARSWGGEISAEWHPLSWWKVQASYSHLRVKGKRTGDLLGDMQVQVFEKSAPRHQAMLVNSVSLTPDLNLHVRLRYSTSTQHYVLNQTDMVEVPAYTGLDVRLGWQFNRNTELSLMGRNLLKDRHTEFINVLPFTRAYDVQRSVLAQAVFRF